MTSEVGDALSHGREACPELRRKTCDRLDSREMKVRRPIPVPLVYVNRWLAAGIRGGICTGITTRACAKVEFLVLQLNLIQYVGACAVLVSDNRLLSMFCRRTGRSLGDCFVILQDGNFDVRSGTVPFHFVCTRLNLLAVYHHFLGYLNVRAVLVGCESGKRQHESHRRQA